MQLMSVILAREGVLFVLAGLVENNCSGSLNPRKGSDGRWGRTWKHGPCCTEQEEWGKKKARSQALVTTLHQKPTSKHL